MTDVGNAFYVFFATKTKWYVFVSFFIGNVNED